MAALIKPARWAHAPELLDLRQLTARDLDEMLTRETRTWKETLYWDFQKSADLVRHFLDERSLYGYALVSAGRIIGYSYYVFEENKGLIGDLYVPPEHENPEHDSRLLTAVLDGLIATPHIHRVECQLMTVNDDAMRSLPGARYLQAFDRDFMLAELDSVSGLPPARLSRRIAIERWDEHHQEAIARLIAESYRDHLDSRINDQYRSVAGARRFLYNIVQYPGCGNFFKPASLVALDLDSGELCGLSLTSLVADDVGHITQLCVSPKVRGMGLGYELLRQSSRSLSEAGCRRASLTVTSANGEAMRLYRNVGFRSLRRFGAYVWEGF